MAELEERLKRLEAALAASANAGATASEVQLANAELRTSNAKFLEANEAVRGQVYQELERAVEVQKDISKVEDPVVRKRAQALLNDAEIDEAEKALLRWENTRYTSDRDNKVGLSISTASDPHRLAGWALGFEMNAPFQALYVRRSASVILAGGASITGGNLNDRGERSLLLLVTGHVGPRVRVGSPSSALSMGVYYDMPLFLMSNGKPRFPLVGAFGDIGWQFGVSRLSLMYRFTALELLYPSQRNLTFIGLRFTGTSSDF